MEVFSIAKARTEQQERQRALDNRESPERFIRRIFGVGVVLTMLTNPTVIRCYDVRRLKKFLLDNDVETIKLHTFKDVWYIGG